MPSNLANTQDLVPLEEIKESTVILKGGRLLKILMVSGVNFSLKSEEEQNIIVYGYQNFLNSLDFPLQVIIHSRKINIDKYLAHLERRKTEELSGLLQSQIAEYKEFVGSFVKENPIMGKSFLVVVPFSSVALPKKESLTRMFPLFKKGEEAKTKEAQEKQADFDHDLSQLDQRVNQVVEGLRAIGLESVALNDEALTELFYNYYNPETVEKENLPLPS